MRRLANLLVVVALVFGLTAACTTTTTRRTPSGEVVQEETTVDADDDGDAGILGTTFGAIGEVLALPFRLVGGLIDAIF